MITFYNGHSFEHMTASGAMGWGKGWLWDRPLIVVGLMKPELFTVIIRSLTLNPRLYPVCNLSWIRPWTWLPWSPWSCIRFIKNNGSINKVGLYNPGFDWWRSEIGPTLDYSKINYVSSLYGTTDELFEMAQKLNQFSGLVAIEVNDSCPNTGHKQQGAESVIRSVSAVVKTSRHPVIVKVSVDQDYLAIAAGLKNVAQAISFNSVPYKRVFPTGPESPLEKIGKPLSGSGGVSGKPAQELNWKAVKELAEQGALPVIGPSVMSREDCNKVRSLGASAISFGAIHLKTPWKPTWIVMEETADRRNLIGEITRLEKKRMGTL